MPATAGRVKMPHNNRVSTSSTLGTNSVWKDVIKYDPYGGDGAGGGGSQADKDSLFEQSKALLELVKASGLKKDKRGACSKCGQMGHMTFECRNHIKFEEKRELEQPVSSDDSSTSDVSSVTSSDSSSSEERPARKHKKSSKKKKSSSTKSKKSRRSRSRDRSRDRADKSKKKHKEKRRSRSRERRKD